MDIVKADQADGEISKQDFRDFVAAEHRLKALEEVTGKLLAANKDLALAVAGLKNQIDWAQRSKQNEAAAQETKTEPVKEIESEALQVGDDVLIKHGDWGNNKGILGERDSDDTAYVSIGGVIATIPISYLEKIPASE